MHEFATRMFRVAFSYMHMTFTDFHNALNFLQTILLFNTFPEKSMNWAFFTEYIFPVCEYIFRICIGGHMHCLLTTASIKWASYHVLSQMRKKNTHICGLLLILHRVRYASLGDKWNGKWKFVIKLKENLQTKIFRMLIWHQLGAAKWIKKNESPWHRFALYVHLMKRSLTFVCWAARHYLIT